MADVWLKTSIINIIFISVTNKQEALGKMWVAVSARL